ncbi:MAG: Flp pilus assembly complex ATPase component TadA [Deltaproteobacteria bacterium]|nr:Flp pilus assembly complex ATPase component TadA [Deltaproteobacteria bacterium]
MTDTRPLILYIDDDRDNRKLVERFLEESYRVITAESGHEGLKIINDTKPDLLLLDIMMPEMDGYEVCSLLQENDETAYIPVIFVTAMGEERDKARAFAVGAADYLVKPIRKNILTDKIETHLQTNAQWSKLHMDDSSWYEKVQSSDFIQFKEFVSGKLGMDTEKRYLFSNMAPPDIYTTSADAGIGEGAMAQYIAQFLKLPYAARINTDDIQLGALPSTFCRSNHVVAVNSPSGERAFIISNPFDWNLMDTLTKFSGLDHASSLTITEPRNIGSLFGDTPSQLKAASSRQTSKVPISAKSLETEIRDHPVVHITNSMLDTAVVERASDIHIEPKEKDTVVRFRIDGDLRDAFTLKKNTGIMVISRLKALGGLDIAEKKKPQDGGFVATLNDRAFNLRLSTTSTPNGESLVMRLLEPYTEPKKLGELGMSGRQTDTMISIANSSSGLILIVGTTGSGKTTTIYSLLHNIDYERRSVMSVEDPVEYRMPFVNQQQVNEKAGVTFEALLKTAVRQDPDVLFMGEVRDNFSAKVAIDFASTGHLTITTLHTSNATTAIFRFERLGIDRGTIADTILAIVAQKLVKKLCPHCKKIAPISTEETARFAPFTNDIPSRVAHPVGCPECNDTGYLGREGTYEVLGFDPEIAEMVRAGASISEIRTFSRNRGDYLISTHAILKVKNLIFTPKDIFEKVLAEEVTAAEMPAPREMGPEIIPASTNATTQASILIVEDDEDTRKLIARFLENDGYSVTTSEDGIDALLYLGKKDFDLILSDVDMPNLDGFKLLEMLNLKGIKAPVIFLTSRINPEDEEKGLKLGAMDYIRKPIKKDLLLLRVKRMLERRG